MFLKRNLSLRIVIAMILLFLTIVFIVLSVIFLTKYSKEKESYKDRIALINIKEHLPNNYQTVWTSYQGIAISNYILAPLKDLIISSCLDSICLTIENSDCKNDEEHKSGLAVDFSKTNDQNYNINMLKFLENNAYKYGFINNSTNPYHYRFVGVNPASTILKNNLTLDEYIKGEENGNIKS